MCEKDEGTRAPARNGCRMDNLRRKSCGNAPSGVEMTPEPWFPTPLRTRRAFRRENDAGGRAIAAITYEKDPPARISRRSVDFRRNRVRKVLSGVIFAPKSTFPQLQRTKSYLRRQILAKGTLFYMALGVFLASCVTGVLPTVMPLRHSRGVQPKYSRNRSEKFDADFMPTRSATCEIGSAGISERMNNPLSSNRS